MELKTNEKVISHIILEQSIASVRTVVALFIFGAVITKLLYDSYFPELIDIDSLRWTIIGLGCIFFLSTFYRGKFSILVPYLSFILYSLTLIYVLTFTLINQFNPAVVTILILIIGASTIIIKSLTYYGVQSAIIIFPSLIVLQGTSLSNENTIAFFNLLIAIGVFAIVISVRLKLVSSVKRSHTNLEKLQALSIVANQRGDIVFVSPTVYSLLGYQPGELVKDGWWQNATLAASWLSREYIIDHPNILARELHTMECSVKTKDGQIKWLSWVNSMQPDGSYMGIALDVTKYKSSQ